MSIGESIRIAVHALLSNKLRAVLTMLGMIIGIAAVIALMSLGKGVQELIQKSFQGLGSNLLFVFPGTLEGGTGARRAALTIGDYEAIADPFQVPDVAGVAPELSSNFDVTAGNRDIRTTISGVTADYLTLRNGKIADGDFISDADVNARSRVAVLGSRAYQKLFDEGAYAIGQTIKINRIPFRVVGVLEEKGGSQFGGIDNTVFVPLATEQVRLLPAYRSRKGEPLLSTVYVQVTSQQTMDRAAEAVTALLRQRHKIAYSNEDDFTVIKQTDIVSILGDLTQVLTIFLSSIAGISLLVGGIGIMNIMLVSVTERTREIGIRKAVGAKRRDIRAQFLVEAVVLALIGGVFGIALGIIASRIVASLAPQLTPLITWDVLLLATGFSAAVGLFFGIYPASRAAALNPIDALRYE